MRRWGVPLLRLALAIVFVWFGLLKVAGVSPAAEVIQRAYPFLPEPSFVVILGAAEVIIGIGLISNRFLRTTLAFLWLHLLGTFVALALAPETFFTAVPFLPTLAGEFVIKNFILAAAGIVIGGHGAKTDSEYH